MTEEKAQKERLDYCEKTITRKHLWHRAIIGNEFIYTNYNQDGTQEAITNPIQANKCFACGVINDTNY